MWTPKRIVLLVIGVVAFCTCYLGYARSHLGTIDGLPTLPEEFRRTDGKRVDPPPPRTSRVEQKLKQAFGLECKELKHPIKLELHSRSMTLAACRTRRGACRCGSSSDSTRSRWSTASIASWRSLCFPIRR